jgi:hypothetical protein
MGEWREVKREGHDFEVEPVISGVLVKKVSNGFDKEDYVLNVKGKGDVLVFYKTALHSKMKNLEPGCVVRITYLGTKIAEKSRREYEDFKVEEFIV